METDINVERDKTPLVILLIVIVIGLGLWLYRGRGEEPTLSTVPLVAGGVDLGPESAVIIPSTNPLEKMPMVNPTARTNPYRSIKTNPFE